MEPNKHVMAVLPIDLEIGDQFWCDEPYKHDWSNGDLMDLLPSFMFVVISEPIESVNTQLFETANSRGDCVVVGVEYPDGARGSRLYHPDTILTIRR
jgi:hypothetical protein